MYVCSGGGAGTRDANQDRDGQGIDMSVRQLHNRLEGVPCAKRASGAERERL